MAIMQTSLPIPDIPQAQAWLRDQQERLATAVGVPLFVTIRIVYDGFVEVDVETFDGRCGTDSRYTNYERIGYRSETRSFVACRWYTLDFGAIGTSED